MVVSVELRLLTTQLLKSDRTLFNGFRLKLETEIDFRPKSNFRNLRSMEMIKNLINVELSVGGTSIEKQDWRRLENILVPNLTLFIYLSPKLRSQCKKSYWKTLKGPKKFFFNLSISLSLQSTCPRRSNKRKKSCEIETHLWIFKLKKCLAWMDSLSQQQTESQNKLSSISKTSQYRWTVQCCFAHIS